MMGEPLKIEAEVLKALAHPTRLRILERLKDGPCCVCRVILRDLKKKEKIMEVL